MTDEFEFPASFNTADAASMRAQARFLRSTRFQLVLMVLASALGAFTWAVAGLEVAALIAGFAFLAAALLRFLLLRRRLHRQWYEGRAAAESIKTLAWRYAVGGDPFPVDNDGDARDAFVSQARPLVDDLVTLERSQAGAEPTASMDALRAAPLETRRRAYVRGRIEDQLSWYSAKSRWNHRRARIWGSSVLILQLGGAAGAFLRGFGIIGLDVFGLAAALAASGAAWLETKQHANLGSAYRVAAAELLRIKDLSATRVDETSWARFVADAEEAVSREHTMWKATTRHPVSLA